MQNIIFKWVEFEICFTRFPQFKFNVRVYVCHRLTLYTRYVPLLFTKRYVRSFVRIHLRNIFVIMLQCLLLLCFIFVFIHVLNVFVLLILICLQCEPISGLGFRRGSYKCTCRKGYYFPDTSLPQKYFNGSTLEEEYEKLMLVRFCFFFFYVCPFVCVVHFIYIYTLFYFYFAWLLLYGT